MSCFKTVTVVSAVKNNGYSTDNVVQLLDSRLEVTDSAVIGLPEGGNFGLYIHKIAIGLLEDSDVAVVGMISHHSEQAHLYVFSIDEERRKLHLLKKLENLSLGSLGRTSAAVGRHLLAERLHRGELGLGAHRQAV